VACVLRTARTYEYHYDKCLAEVAHVIADPETVTPAQSFLYRYREHKRKQEDFVVLTAMSRKLSSVTQILTNDCNA